MLIDIKMFSALLFLAMVGLSGPLQAQTSEAIGQRVPQIFADKCVSCHDRATAKKIKGDFDNVLDLQAVAKELVAPGDPEDSDLWLSIVDEDEPMPPEDSDEEALSIDELATIRWWILSGAKYVPADGIPATPTPKEKKERGLVPRWGESHPLFLHFPIALVFAAILAELLTLAFAKVKLASTAHYCLLVAVVGVWVTLFSGFAAQDSAGYSDATVETHERLAIGAAVFLTLTTLSSLIGCRRKTKSWVLAYRLLLVVAGIFVAAAGHFGGQLAH